MGKTIKIIIFTAIIVFLTFILVFTQNTSQVSLSNSTNFFNKSITSEELLKHNSKTDCWVAYKGNVYDITKWLPKHPGTSTVIEPYCGTSSGFEQAFTNKHGTSKASLLMKVAQVTGYFKEVGNTQ